MKQVAVAEADMSGQAEATRPASQPDERPASFETLFGEQYEPMVRVAFLMLGSRAEAEDVVQDAFARVQLRAGRLDNPGGYLRRCVVNRATDVLRRRRVEERIGLFRHERSNEMAADEMTDALAALSPRRRAVVVLRFYGGLRESEIAETLGIRPGTVKSSLHRALSELREAIER